MNIFNSDLEAVEAARLGPLDLCGNKSVSWVSEARRNRRGLPPVCEGLPPGVKGREIDLCAVEYCARFSLTMPSLAAKNARTVELNRPAPGRPGLWRGGSARSKRQAPRRRHDGATGRDKLSQSLALPTATTRGAPPRTGNVSE